MKLLTALLLLVLPLTGLAASMIESRDARNQVSHIYFEADRARMEIPQQKGYMVLDVKNRTMKAVVPEQRMVMDMSSLLQNNTSTASTGQTDSQIKSRGAGPVIAGYKTREYALHADGKYCGSAFVSAEIMSDLKLQKFADAMQTLGNQMEQRLAGMNMKQTLSPCDSARSTLGQRMQEFGFPMRLTGENKKIISEVTRVHKNAKLPANAFAAPADYQVVNPDKMMQDAMKQMPQMKEMMKNMSPEAMESMRKQMEQMFQQ